MPAIQREYALLMQDVMEELATAISQGHPVMKAAEAVRAKFVGTIYSDGKETRVLSITTGGIKNLYYRWREAERSVAVFAPEKKGRRREVPDGLVQWLRSECTLPGVEASSVVLDKLKTMWRRNDDVPGLGRWQEWWARERAGWPLPEKAPEFPIHDRTLYRYCPRKGSAIRVRGNRGKAAAAKLLPHVTLNYSNLKPGEAFVFDDVRLDILCLDNATGLPTECKAYIAMEMGTRFIPAFILRPANSLFKSDVDELVVAALQNVGLCQDGTTKLIFERGTLTMSREGAKVLHAVTDGLIQVIHNGMDAEVSTDGYADSGKGHWMGKGVIESFMRKIHLALMNLPGQRGSSYAKQPDSLGYAGIVKKAKRGTLAEEAGHLASIQLAFGTRVKLDCGLLWINEVRSVLAEAIKLHNANRDHAYQGHGYVTLVETAPGVWKDAV